MVKIRMRELKPCPLCGGKPRFVKETVHMTEAYRVECKNCHFSTEYVFTGLKGLPNSGMVLSYETPTIAKHNAGIMWNKLPVNRYACMSTCDKVLLRQKNLFENRQLAKKAGVEICE